MNPRLQVEAGDAHTRTEFGFDLIAVRLFRHIEIVRSSFGCTIRSSQASAACVSFKTEAILEQRIHIFLGVASDPGPG